MLRGAIKDAVDYLKRQRGAIKIGEGWANIKSHIEKLQAKDRTRSGDKRIHRLISSDEFFRMARDIGLVEDQGEAKILLRYLHDIGTLFFQTGQFDEQIILDQQWALDAIYAVFHRDNGLYKVIEENRGRFTQSLLDRWVWKDKYTKAEQSSLVGMMKSCDICFTIRRKSEIYGEAVYVAPDLLPRIENLFDDRLDGWDGIDAKNSAIYRFDLLPPALLRHLMSQIGQRVGQHALYWRNGLYFSDGETGSKARIDALLDNPKAWSGCLKVRTREGQSDRLLAQLVKMIETQCQQIGTEAQGVEKPDFHQFDQEAARLKQNPLSVETKALEGMEDVEFSTSRGDLTIQPDLKVSDKEECFISYSWGDDLNPNCERNQAFEKTRERLEGLDFSPFFDKDRISNSEAISAFMDRATNRPKSIVILSEKYMKSPFCMFELTSLYRKAKSNPQILRETCRVIVLDDVSISQDEDWLRWQDYWDKQVERYDELMKGRLPRKIPKKTLDNSKYVSDFANVIGDILAAFSDTVHYRGLDAINEITF